MVIARRSRKKIAPSVALLLAALIPPVVGNLIIVLSEEKMLSLVGYYFYFLGMNMVMFALMRFTIQYCDIIGRGKYIERAANIFLLLDAIQYIFNPFYGQAFSIVRQLVYRKPYYNLVPHLGQTVHRVVNYGVLILVLGIFFYKTYKSLRINAEKYYIIILALVVGGLWETYYIFSRVPIDRSMIGFGVFGLCVFYFALYYRPYRLLDQMLAKVASRMNEALYFFDPSGICIWVNEPGREFAHIEKDHYEGVQNYLKNYFGVEDENEDEWKTDFVIGDGEDERYYYIEKHVIKNEKGRMSGFFVRIHDNTEETRKLKETRYNATHDSLTGLYNKERLFEEIRIMLDENPEKEYLIVYIDVDDFKMVNEVFGNQFGDFVLKYLADKISGLCTEVSVYGRLVSDTFGMCIPEDRFDEKEIVERLANFTLSNGDMDQNILLHIGVYKVEERDIDIAAMFDRARMAVSTIKKEYHKYIAYYDSKMREEAVWSQHISTQLDDALRDGQIRPYLQPIVDNEGRVMGAEALVRWIHPTDGFMSPGSFIPVFEKNGMIADVDRHMWRSACEILAKWKRIGLDMFISINISPKDFYFMDVAKVIKDLVREYEISPQNLRIEITETIMITENEKHMKVLNELRDAGFLIEMDDFGSGFSSLNMLKDMPIDLIKIDMVFLRETKDVEKARIILKNIITLSDELKLISLTEGVETEEQFTSLAEMGCKLFQGYHFSKPLPVNEFEKYIGL